jgi:hypothetical protein
LDWHEQLVSGELRRTISEKSGMQLDKN